MAVTQQDVIDNAAGIAQLINGAPADVDINALPEETSWTSSDFAHIQKSGVDSKIKKENMGAGSTDPNAIHDNEAGEIAAITEKTAPVADDLLLIEDSADSDAKKKAKSSNLFAVIPLWNSGYTYANNAVINYLGILYSSLQTANLNKIPVSEPTWWEAIGGGGSTPDFLIDFPAGGWDYPAANFAPWDTDSGTNGNIRRNLFDDTIEEFVEAQFKLPTDMSTTGADLITFYLEGYAVAAVASKNIEFTFYHSAKADGENWDAVFSSKVSGDLACDATQDQLDFFSWTETITNLGWAPGDHVRIRLSRTAPSADNLSGDYGMTNFRIKVPRA